MVIWLENMLFNPCPVCQDRQTRSFTVWLLDPWNIGTDPRLHVSSRRGINIFPVKVFPSPEPVSSHFRSALKDWDACRIHSQPNRMSVWNGCWVPVKDAFQQTGGFPAARGGIVPGRGSGGDGWGGRKRQGEGSGAQNGASCSTTMGNLVWAVALNTSILTWGRQEIGFL